MSLAQRSINFHDWIGDSWAILFSHPKDFTPVCTTELGYAARLEPEFTKRNCKLIGLSIDPVDNHALWVVVAAKSGAISLILSDMLCSSE